MASLTDNLQTILDSNGQSGGYAANFNRFDYYSGSQITVWFGDIMLDDIVSIQWSRQQSKKPIYGYASQQFDSVAKGTVIVQGSFIINFRQAGFLPLVIAEISKLYGTNQTAVQQNWDVVRQVIGTHLKNGTFGPQTVQDITDLGNSPDFLSLVKSYEDVIWGGGVPGAGSSTDQKFTDSLRKFLPADVRQHEMIPDGFNILITYGNNSANDPKTLNDYLQSTTKSIVGVHLVGDSQVIQVGGQAVMEQYDFIARGTDEFIGTSR